MAKKKNPLPLHIKRQIIQRETIKRNVERRKAQQWTQNELSLTTEGLRTNKASQSLRARLRADQTQAQSGDANGSEHNTSDEPSEK